MSTVVGAVHGQNRYAPNTFHALHYCTSCSRSTPRSGRITVGKPSPKSVVSCQWSLGINPLSLPTVCGSGTAGRGNQIHQRSDSPPNVRPFSRAKESCSKWVNSVDAVPIAGLKQYIRCYPVLAYRALLAVICVRFRRGRDGLGRSARWGSHYHHQQKVTPMMTVDVNAMVKISFYSKFFQKFLIFRYSTAIFPFSF